MSSKVFSYFGENICVNNRIAIPIIIIIIGIVIVTVGVVATSNQESNTTSVGDIFDKELVPDEDGATEIQEKLHDIEDAAAENKYLPKPREWITSGPFQIDRSEYILGEKIFMRVNTLGWNEKGEAVFLRPLNSTHYSVYLTIPFDGSDVESFNYYLGPKLSKINKYCSIDDFVGDWRVEFRGTDYPSLKFKITKEILPGEEESYQPVC